MAAMSQCFFRRARCPSIWLAREEQKRGGDHKQNQRFPGRVPTGVMHIVLSGKSYDTSNNFKKFLVIDPSTP